jgi:hypothetical protein
MDQASWQKKVLQVQYRKRSRAIRTLQVQVLYDMDMPLYTTYLALVLVCTVQVQYLLFRSLLARAIWQGSTFFI